MCSVDDVVVVFFDLDKDEEGRGVLLAVAAKDKASGVKFVFKRRRAKPRRAGCDVVPQLRQYEAVVL